MKSIQHPVTYALRQASFLKSFECLGADCPDSCCVGWNAQLDPAMRERYATVHPELLNAVTPDETGGFCMKRDPATNSCVMLEGGLCGIQKKYGTDFLGDACHFYPRVTHRLGDAVLMTAAPSCPEVIRLALFGDYSLHLEDAAADRLPYSLKDYLPERMDSAQAFAVHVAFMEAANDMSVTPEHVFARIVNAAHALEKLPPAEWPRIASSVLAQADAHLPPAEMKPEDPFNLLHALCGSVATTGRKITPRLAETIAAMERALHTELDWQTIGITTYDDSLSRYRTLRAEWNAEYAVQYAAILRRWLQLQLSVALFPFAGFGSTLTERVTIIGVRFATFRLAMMCSCGILGTILPQDVVVRIAQSLSRALDHFADPAFSMQVYEEVGWNKEGRMRGLTAG